MIREEGRGGKGRPNGSEGRRDRDEEGKGRTKEETEEEGRFGRTASLSACPAGSIPMDN